MFYIIFKYAQSFLFPGNFQQQNIWSTQFYLLKIIKEQTQLETKTTSQVPKTLIPRPQTFCCLLQAKSRWKDATRGKCGCPSQTGTVHRSPELCQAFQGLLPLLPHQNLIFSKISLITEENPQKHTDRKSINKRK